ncbi:MAG: hypothetical protein GX557_08420 [Chloroflexi bacterium]|nr:hypothetical protein [Chloroflexota bacterium]
MAVQTVRIDTLPGTVEAFVEAADGLAATPEGGAGAFVLALAIAADNVMLGRQCLAAVAAPGRLQPGAHGYKGQELRRSDLQLIERQIVKQRYLPLAYLQGATPENAYTRPALPWEVLVSTNPYSGEPETGRVKLFVACSGAASPRPVTLERDAHGRWRAAEWSSLVMGIVAPRQS